MSAVSLKFANDPSSTDRLILEIEIVGIEVSSLSDTLTDPTLGDPT